MTAGGKRVYAGLGSNLDRKLNLRRAVAGLRDAVGELRVSPVYRNAAVGFDGPDFFNLVVGFDSDLSPAALLGLFASLQRRAGREADSERFASRTLDVDLLLYGDRVADDPPLPRPDVLEYAFVLKPLADIAPDLLHPQTGRRLAAHWAEWRGEHRLTRVDVDFGSPPPADRS